MKVLFVFLSVGLLWTAAPFSAAEQMMQSPCTYVEDPNDARLQAVSYLQSNIQCAVYSNQNGYDLMNFQDGVCKLGFSVLPTTAVSTNAISTTQDAIESTSVPASVATMTPATSIPTSTMMPTTRNTISCSSTMQTFLTPSMTSMNVTTCVDSGSGVNIAFVPGRSANALACNGICGFMGKKLAPLRNLTINNAAKAMARRFFATNFPGFWTGGGYIGSWVWNLGAQFSYTDWCSGEPSSNLSSCVMLKENLGSMCWVSVTCSTSAPFMCSDMNV